MAIVQHPNPEPEKLLYWREIWRRHAQQVMKGKPPHVSSDERTVIAKRVGYTGDALGRLPQ